MGGEPLIACWCLLLWELLQAFQQSNLGPQREESGSPAICNTGSWIMHIMVGHVFSVAILSDQQERVKTRHWSMQFWTPQSLGHSHRVAVQRPVRRPVKSPSTQLLRHDLWSVGHLNAPKFSVACSDCYRTSYGCQCMEMLGWHSFC